MQSSKSNSAWRLVLLLIFLRPFICQRCYPAFDIYYSLAFLFCALLWLIFSPKASFKSSLTYPLLLLVIALGLSTLFSINSRLSLGQIYKFIPYFAAFYLISPTTQEHKKQLLLSFIAAACLLSFYGIYQFFWGFQNILDYFSRTEPYPYAEEFLGRKRVFATFFSPDMFAGYLIVIIPLAMGLFLDSLIKKRRLLWILTGLSLSFMSIALLLTKSIGAWISLLAAFLVFAVLLFVRRPPLLRRKILLGTAITCIVIISILTGIFLIRTEQFFDFDNPQNSIIQRLYFWKAGVKIIKDFPYAGVGLGNFGLIYPNYKSPEAFQTHFAHNSYLQIWAETGIVGFLAWLWLISRSFRAGLRNLKVGSGQNYLTIALIAASAAFLVHNFIDFDFFIPEVAFHWWAILGLISFNAVCLANSQ